MGLAQTTTYSVDGVTAAPVRVEVHTSGGLPSFNIVGLAEAAVRESRERVRSALINSGFEFPPSRITVNLAPADIRKSGGGLDLAIAVGLLVATAQMRPNLAERHSYFGELSLDGQLQPSPGLLAAALAAIEIGKPLIHAAGPCGDLALIAADSSLEATHLIQVFDYLSKQGELSPPVPKPPTETIGFAPSSVQDLADLIGQINARRGLEIAAAGGHNLLFVGPPGAGKSMLAASLPGILPPLTREHALQTAVIHSICGRSRDNPYQPPLRAPHHTASAASMVGGGSPPKPGEVSLAHQGVLFLDELPEFAPKVLQTLREPLETGEICISRANYACTFPARFQLLAAMNPCPCGYAGSSRCTCPAELINRYQRRISGPLLDRIDMWIFVDAVRPDEIIGASGTGETSAAVRARVVAANRRQLERQSCSNAMLRGPQLEQLVIRNSACREFITRAADRLNLSVRGLHRAMRVAATIADLNNEDPGLPHLQEAMAYRTPIAGGTS